MKKVNYFNYANTMSAHAIVNWEPENVDIKKVAKHIVDKLKRVVNKKNILKVIGNEMLMIKKYNQVH